MRTAAATSISAAMNATTGAAAETTAKAGASALPHRQRGVILIIVLLVLIALSLTAVSLARTTDTALLIAGNIAFKQGTTAMADRGVEAARRWLLDNAGDALENSIPDEAYFASNAVAVDFTGNDDWWDGAKTLAAAGAGDPYTVRYVIHRLCEKSGAYTDVGTGCQTPSTSIPCNDQPCDPPAPSSPYYQVTVRVDGPRNTVSHVQAILN